MSDEKVLTKEIAEQIQRQAEQSGEQADFREFTTIEDAAAESLSKNVEDLKRNLDNLPASAAKILRDAGHGD